MDKILIDDREPELCFWFDKFNFSYQKQRLEVGDLCLGKAVIERKEGNDFVSSLLDGRLVNQINNMQDNFEKCCIVVHGNIFDLQSEVRHTSITGMIASICVRTNVNIVMFSGWEALTYFCYQYLVKSNENKEFSSNIIIKPRTTDVNLRILMQIDGISKIKAEKILLKYKGIKGLKGISINELKQIDGIGQKLAERIYNIFT